MRDIILTGLSGYSNTIHLPMIKIKALKYDNINLSNYDYLMFTSKTAIKIFIKKYKNVDIPPIITIENSSAKLLKELGKAVHYISSGGYLTTLNNEIKEKFSTKKILWPSSYKTLLNENEKSKNITNIKIYKTECIKYSSEYSPKKNSIIIFTSPSTVRCFLTNFKWMKSYTALAIGNSTKKELRINNINSIISKDKSLKSIFDLATKYVKIYEPR